MTQKKASSLQEDFHEQPRTEKVSSPLALDWNSRRIKDSRLGIYIGESSRSLFERSKEHIKDANTFKADSHVIKHWILNHPLLDKMPPMSIRITDTYSDCLSRQLGEALKIHFSNDILLNGRNEYLSNCVTRLTTSESLSDRRDRDRREEEEEIQWKIRVDEFKKQKEKSAKDQPPPETTPSQEEENQGKQENQEPGENPMDNIRKRKKRRLNEYEGFKESNHLEQTPSDKKEESTGKELQKLKSVIPSIRKASRRKAERKEEYDLAWFKLWWRRMEREGEQEYRDRRLEQSSSSNLMSKFLVRGKQEQELSKKELLFKNELSDKNLRGSAAEYTSHQQLGVGVKWGCSEKTNIIQGSEDSPAKRRKINQQFCDLSNVWGEWGKTKPGERTPPTSLAAKSE